MKETSTIISIVGILFGPNVKETANYLKIAESNFGPIGRRQAPIFGLQITIWAQL